MNTIIYGLGQRFEEYLISRDNPLESVVALADKSKDKQAKIYDGFAVISPGEIKDHEYDQILVSSVNYFDEIRDELVAIGCDANKIKKLEFESTKYSGELGYWKLKYRQENGSFINSRYEKMFLDIAGEQDDSYMKDKVVADFGCGPRGSLAWTDAPKVKIGIDVLANSYMRFFGDCLEKHGMIYVNSDEYRIPLPTDYVDVMSTINSLDHVAVLDNMVNEICRVIKTGGLFIGSFNLNEPASQCEPQTLTEELLYDTLLKRFDIIDKRIALKGKDDSYSEIRAGRYVDCLPEDSMGVMWVKAVLK